MTELNLHKKVILKGNYDYIILPLFSSDPCYLITVSRYHSPRNDAVKIWELETSRIVRSFENESVIRSISVSSDILYILCGSEVWELELKSWKPTLLWSQGCSQDWALWKNLMRLTPNGHYVVTGSEGNTVKVLDIRSGRQLTKFGGHRFPITNIDISPDGLYVITKSQDSLKIWKLYSGELILTLKQETSLNMVRFSSEEQKLIRTVDYNNIEIWDLVSGKKTHNLKGHTSYIRDLAVFDKSIASGSNDKTVRIWSIESGQLLHKLNCILGVNAVAISPNGHFIASSSSDTINSKIKIWSYQTGELLLDTWSEGIINSIIFSPSSKYLFTTSNKSAILWEMVH